METLRFLHIPKTAGSTFSLILRRQYYGRKIFSFTGDIVRDFEKYNSLSDDIQRKIGLFLGHAPIKTGIELADNATIITFIRNPISRVKSFCQHVSEGKSPYLLKEFPPEKFDLDDFLDSGNDELFNLQTKMLINSGSCTVFPENLSENDAIDLALNNLFNKVSYFGIQEYFDESLLLFRSAFSWRNPFYISKNKKDFRKLLKFEDRHNEKIKELNKLDLEIYRAGEEHFLKLLQGKKIYKNLLKRFQKLNRFSSPIVKIEDRLLNHKQKKDIVNR